MAIGNDDTRLYVANMTVSAPHVTIIDISPRPGGGRKNAVVGSIDLGSQGARSAYTVAAMGVFLAVGTQSGHVVVYDTSKIPVKCLATREIGARVKHLTFSPLGTKLYALLASSRGAVDENGAPTPAGNVQVLRFPSLALKSVLSLGTSELRRATVVNNAYLYLTDLRGNLHVIDIGTDTLLSTTNLGSQLSGITANESKVFVTDPTRSLILTIVPTGDSRKDRLEKPIFLEDRAVPIGLVVMRGSPKGKP
jgi:DNA-binding beta-propeller fold protein YncE